MNRAQRRDKRVLLIDPPYFRGRTLWWSQYLIPNVGLAALAASIRGAGYPIEVLDASTLGWDVARCVAEIRRRRPWVVGISAMTHNIVTSGEVARGVKESLPDAHTILGGTHVTSVPRETMRRLPHVDAGVVGEGEDATLELLDFLASEPGEAPAGIPGVVYRDGGDIVVNETKRPFVDLDSQPFPAWDLFPMEKYIPVYRVASGKRQVQIQTARGCPHKCVFCNNFNGHKMRFRDVEGVLEEIEHAIRTQNAGSIHFVDESLPTNNKRAARLFEGILSRGLHKKVKWLCAARADQITPEIARLMKRAGCFDISVGVESGNQDILDRSGKNLKLETASHAIDCVANADISPDALFLIGMPHETRSTILDTIRFAKSLNTNQASFSNAVPYPGTRMHEMGRNGEGGVRLLSDDWALFERHLAYVAELETVSVRQLKALHFLAYASFYASTPRRAQKFFNKVNVKVLPRYLLKTLSGAST